MTYATVKLLLSLLALFDLLVVSGHSSSISRDILIEREKARLLRKLNLSQKPVIEESDRIWRVPRDLTGIQNKLDEQDVSTQEYKPINKNYCLTLDRETKITDCFIYNLKTTGILVNTDVVLRLRPYMNQHNLTVHVYEVSRLDGHRSRLDRIVIPGGDPTEDFSVSIDIKEYTQNWFRYSREHYLEKFISVGVKVDGEERMFGEIFREQPKIEMTVAERKTDFEEKCSASAPCCVMPFFLNFTELGWDDFILSPTGYYANFCEGLCPEDPPHSDIHSFLQGASSNDSAMEVPSSQCAPVYYGSISVIYIAGKNDYRKSTLHGMRVISCNCNSH